MTYRRQTCGGDVIVVVNSNGRWSQQQQQQQQDRDVMIDHHEQSALNSRGPAAASPCSLTPSPATHSLISPCVILTDSV